MLNQPANVAYRQDLVSIESSVDEGQNWIQHILVELDKSDRLSCIDVPSPRPAKLWRVVARGYNASAEERAWTPIGVDFFVTLESSLQQSRMRFETEAEARTLPGSRVPVPPSAEKLVPATLRADHVIGSSTPERLGLLVDGSLETFWVSGESGQSVRDHAWIGYQFAAPASVGEIVLLQTNVHEYRQDKVAVETRNSPDEDWCRIADFDLVAGAVESKMRIFSPHQATTWRIVACGENATAPSHRWTPLGIGLKLREESPALKTRLARAVGAMRRGMSHSF